MAALRILLVDDDDLIREATTPLLADSLGHQVHAAPGGLEALALLEDGLEVDLVILDVNMPGFNGAQTLERLLALRPGQTVLMATGNSEDSLAPLLALGPNVSSIHKPFSLGEMQDTIRRIFA
jgi:CheY-like chemotaxis protein